MKNSSGLCGKGKMIAGTLVAAGALFLLSAHIPGAEEWFHHLIDWLAE